MLFELSCSKLLIAELGSALLICRWLQSLNRNESIHSLTIPIGCGGGIKSMHKKAVQTRT